jgi:hypothetical protein
MLTDLHNHMVGEVQQSARTDTVFVVTGVLFNIVILGVSWVVASPDGPTRVHTASHDAILGALIVVTLSINALLLSGLASGRDRMQRLLAGITAIYVDAGVDKYYDPSLRASYRSRYTAFMGVLAILTLAAILVPMLERLTS